MILDLVAVALLLTLTATVIAHIIRDFRRGEWLNELIGIIVAIVMLVFIESRL